ncbi:MAG: hypothetical protein ABFS03_08000 [Chloroflexota bacterium]
MTRAWEIIWKFKVLWLFGILASCGQGGSGSSTSSGGGGGKTGFQFDAGSFNLPPEMQRYILRADRFFDSIEAWQIAALIGGFFLFSLIIGLIFNALSTIGRVGIIQGTVEAEGGVDRLSFGDLFTSGKPFFWRVFGLNLLIGIALLIAFLIIIIPAIGITALTLGIGLICLIPLICILIPLSWMVSVIIEQANIALVVEDLGMMPALQRGWAVFRENLGSMIIMGLILGVLSFVISLIFALPILLIIFPVVFGIAGGAITDAEAFVGGGFAVAALCFMAYLPFLIVLGGILRSYINTAWTLTYLELTTEAAPESDDASLLTETAEEI